MRTCVCVLPILLFYTIVWFVFLRNLNVKSIFTKRHLNFRWEAENEKHRQRVESCLEWGEDTDALSADFALIFSQIVLHPQYRGLIADSRWPVPPHPSSRCSSSIWRAKLWIPPPSSTWWWKTTRLLGKISKCNTCWAGRYAYFWHSVAKCVSCLYTAQRVAVWSGCASSRSRCSSWLVVSLASVSTR